MIDERNRRRLKQALIDPFNPPSPNLQRIAVASLEQSARHRTSTRVLAVAAFLVFMALAASIALAGHLLPVSSGPVHLSPRQIALQLAQLRQRQLELPVLRPNGSPNGTCPVGPQPLKQVYFKIGPPQAVAEYVVGNHGPIYGLGGPEVATDHGYYYQVTYLSDAKYQGLALVRGRRLDGPQRLMFSGPLAAGSLVTTDTIEGKSTQFFDELVLPQASPTSSVWRQWPVLQGVPGAGCYGFQIDGPSFHDTFAIYVPQGG